ncbi:MAG TPA: hypothetical protein DIS94_06100 [Bacteroidetes bacterium]|nr:hypothetical protein [Bacteroidota bacterium]
MTPFLKWVRKNPAVKFCIIFIAGIFAGSYSFIPIYISLSIPLVLFILFFKFKNSFLTALIIFSCGFLKSNIDFFLTGSDNVSRIPDSEKFEYTLSGVVSSVISKNEEATKFIIDSKYIYNSSDSLSINGKVLVNLFKGKFSNEEIKIPDIKENYYIKITGRFNSPLPYRNPGDFDYAKYLEINGIRKIITSNNPQSISILNNSYNNNFFSNLIYSTRDYSDKVINYYYSGDNKGFIEGLVTGQRDDISKETKTNFINTGIMHILAVSGFNVAIVLVFILVSLSLFRFKRHHAMIVAIPFLIFYCFYTTMAPSIIRATLMGVLVIIGFLIERRLEFYNIVAFSAILILAADAKQLFDAGFILSYAAVISMVFVYDNVFKITEKKLSKYNFTNNKIFRWCFTFILISISAIIGTLPVSAYFFDKIPVVSIIANILAVPLANFILISSFLQIIFSTFSAFLSSSIAYLNNFLLNHFFNAIDYIANIKYAFIYFYKFDVFNILIYYVILILLITATKINLFKRIIFASMIIIFAITINSLNTNENKLTVLNYFESDIILMRGDNGKTILVYEGDKFRNIKNKLIPYLQSEGINKIDVLIFSGIEINEGVINEFKTGIQIGEIYAPYHNNFNYNQIGAGDVITIDNSSSLFITRPFRNEISDVNFIYKNREDEFVYSNDGMKFNCKFFNPENTGALIFNESKSGLLISNQK